jgi:hypothetical protein
VLEEANIWNFDTLTIYSDNICMPEISRFLGIVICMFIEIMRRRTFMPNMANTKSPWTLRRARYTATFHDERSALC